MLDARQLGLKLIANVTYGYTSANFSGRMPCVEVTVFLLHFKLVFCCFLFVCFCGCHKSHGFDYHVAVQIRLTSLLGDFDRKGMLSIQVKFIWPIQS